MIDTNREADRRGKLRFRSWHRGTREMDLLMGGFADAHSGTFTPDQMEQYESILQLSDPDIYNWITGMESVPPEHDSEVMRLLIGYRFAANTIESPPPRGEG